MPNQDFRFLIAWKMLCRTGDFPCDAGPMEWMYHRELYPDGWCKYGSGRISSSNNGSRMMNRSHSHRNLLWSNHWLVAFHKLTGTLLYSLFVSWSFCWQSNGRVDGFQCVLYKMRAVTSCPIIFSDFGATPKINQLLSVLRNGHFEWFPFLTR